MKPVDVSDPVELEEAAKVVEQLRSDIRGEGDLSGSSVMAEPHFRMALANLETAAQNLKLASSHQAQANAAGRPRW